MIEWLKCLQDVCLQLLGHCNLETLQFGDAPSSKAPNIEKDPAHTTMLLLTYVLQVCVSSTVFEPYMMIRAQVRLIISLLPASLHQRRLFATLVAAHRSFIRRRWLNRKLDYHAYYSLNAQAGDNTISASLSKRSHRTQREGKSRRQADLCTRWQRSDIFVCVIIDVVCVSSPHPHPDSSWLQHLNP